MTVTDDELRRRLSALADHAAATPSRPVTDGGDAFDQRRSGRRIGAAVTAVALIAASLVAVVVVHANDHQAARQVLTTPAPGAGLILPPAPLAARTGMASAWTGTSWLLWGGDGDRSQVFADGAAYDPRARHWQPLAGAPLSARHDPASVWTGHQWLIVGGTTANGTFTKDGAAYDPAAGRWAPLPAAPIELGLAPTAVWTGTEMIINAGADVAIGAAAYNPTSRTWRTLSMPPGASAAGDPQAVWTGRQAVFMLDTTPTGPAAPKPCCPSPTAPGAQTPPYACPGAATTCPQPVPSASPVSSLQLAALDPATGRWTVAGLKATGPSGPVLAWTGSEILEIEPQQKSFAWNPTTGALRVIASPAQAAPPPALDRLAWTGTQAVAWTGDTLWTYTAAVDRWTTTSTPLAARTGAALAWTGSEVLGWGGSSPGRMQALVDGIAAPSPPLPPTPPPTTPAPPVPQATDATFLDAAHAWLLLATCDGSNTCTTTLEASADGGASFRTLGAGPNLAPRYNAYDLTFATTADGFLAGPNLWATHDGGRTWAPAPLPGDVIDLAAAGSSVWALTAPCQTADQPCPPSAHGPATLHQSDDAGRTWHAAPAQPPVTGTMVHNGAAEGLIVGPVTRGGTQHGPSLLASTADGGRTWRRTAAPCSADIPPDSAFLSRSPGDGTLWLACAGQPSAGSQGKAVYRSADNGDSWTTVASCGYNATTCTGRIGGGYLKGLISFNAQRAYLLLARGPVLGTDDAGVTWAPAPPANGCDGTFGPGNALDSTHAWVLSQGPPDCPGAGLWTTADSGSSWTKVWSPALGPIAACASADLTIITSGLGAALGHASVAVLFKNIGQRPCRLTGYPGVAGLDESGRQAVQAERSLAGYIGGWRSGGPLPVVDLAPGDTASALLEGTNIPEGAPRSCPSYPAILVTPPDDTRSTFLSASIPGCSALQIHPIVPGPSGTAP